LLTFKAFLDFCICPVKKVSDFPVPSRDVTNQLKLAGNNSIILKESFDSEMQGWDRENR
jgi:hypothetical protein